MSTIVIILIVNLRQINTSLILTGPFVCDAFFNWSWVFINWRFDDQPAVTTTKGLTYIKKNKWRVTKGKMLIQKVREALLLNLSDKDNILVNPWPAPLHAIHWKYHLQYWSQLLTSIFKRYIIAYSYPIMR